MNKQNQAQLKMFEAVIEFLDNNPALVTALAILATLKTQLGGCIQRIADAYAIILTPLTGITLQKDEARKNMNVLLFEICNGLRAYATSVNNMNLYNAVNFSISDIEHLNDSKISSFAIQIHAKATDHIASLPPFGIDAAVLAALTAAMSSFEHLKVEHRDAIALRMAQKGIIKQNINDARNILVMNMDPIVYTRISVEPSIVDQYKNVRRIINLPIHHTNLKGSVTDAASNAPIPNAAIVIEELGITLKSLPDGAYGKDKIKPGTYTITVTADGYQTKVYNNIKLKLGKNNELFIKLNLIN